MHYKCKWSFCCFLTYRWIKCCSLSSGIRNSGLIYRRGSPTAWGEMCMFLALVSDLSSNFITLKIPTAWGTYFEIKHTPKYVKVHQNTSKRVKVLWNSHNIHSASTRQIWKVQLKLVINFSFLCSNFRGCNYFLGSSFLDIYLCESNLEESINSETGYYSCNSEERSGGH